MYYYTHLRTSFLFGTLWSFRWLLLRRFRLFAVFVVGLFGQMKTSFSSRGFLRVAWIDKRRKESYSAFFGNPLIYHSSKERSTNGFKSCAKEAKKFPIAAKLKNVKWKHFDMLNHFSMSFVKHVRKWRVKPGYNQFWDTNSNMSFICIFKEFSKIKMYSVKSKCIQ